MSDNTEVKQLIETSAKLVSEIRSEVESVKSKDAVTETKLAKMETELAGALSAKSALEARLDAIETAANRPGSTKGAEKTNEVKAAFLETVRNRTESQKAAYNELLKKSDLMHTQTPATGGILVPTEFVRDILTGLEEVSPIRKLARVFQVSTTDIRIPVATSGATVKWAGELDTREPTDIPQFAESKPSFGEVYALIRASQWMLDDAYFDLGDFLRKEIITAMAEEESKVFATGDGVDKPQGYLNAAGVPVVNTGNANGLGENVDALLTLPYALKSGYRANAKLVVATSTVAKLVTVKDANGAYMFQRALDAASPDRFAGYQIATDENIPAIAAGSNFAVLADWNRFYGIFDRIYFRLIEDNVTQPGFVRFYASRRLGGNVLDKNAGVILKAAV